MHSSVFSATKQKRRNNQRNEQRLTSIEMTTEEDLSKCTVPLEFLHERASDLALQHIVEKTSEQFAVVVEALKRDFLRYVVRGVRHCLTNRASESERVACAFVREECEAEQVERVKRVKRNGCVFGRECGARVLCCEGNCQVAVTAGTAEGRFGLWLALKTFGSASNPER